MTPATYNHMVVGVRNDAAADLLLRALADGTRRDILRRTLHTEHSVSSLADQYPMSFAAVQKHVAVLGQVELITKRRQGREQLVRANVETIRCAGRLFDQFEMLWRQRLDQFGDVLAETMLAETTKGTQP